MAEVTVQFRYLTGLKRRIFRNARLVGNWDHAGTAVARPGPRPP